MVLIAAVILGLASSVFLWYGKLITAAVLLHLRDVCDASDGSLARLRGMTTRIGRFLDSLGDMLVLTVVIAVITIKAFLASGENVYIGLGIITWFSLFIQCSYFNYYQLKYAESLDKPLQAKLEEKSKGDSDSQSVKVLRLFYRVLYSWQDLLIRQIDRLSISIVDIYPGFDQNEWYRDKIFLTLNSLLCFGTHIFVFCICFVFGNPVLALYIIAIMFNLYFFALMAGRIMAYKIKLAESSARKLTGNRR
jgi:phosphatidylglycerophosphate synthase